MSTLRTFLVSLLTAASLTLVASPSSAQEDDGDSGSSDDPGGMEDGGKKSRGGKKAGPPVKIREVVKGFYARVDIGYLAWLGLNYVDGAGNSLSSVSGGNAVDVAFGYDIVDQLGFTLSVEGDFFQGINNGVTSTECGCQSPVQGDFRSIGGLGRAKFGLNFGGRKIRRLSAYFHAGGGVFVAPSLRPDEQGTPEAGLIHSGPAGLISGGAGLEYYTRLSHFSLGVDLSVYVVVGMAVTPIGIAAAPFIKYTF